jgi:hypothetical protein
MNLFTAATLQINTPVVDVITKGRIRRRTDSLDTAALLAWLLGGDALGNATGPR